MKKPKKKPKAKPNVSMRLGEFLDDKGIKTHSLYQGTWMAIYLSEEDRDKPILQVIAESGWLYGQVGCVAGGPDELSAVRRLCQQRNIPCEL